MAPLRLHCDPDAARITACGARVQHAGVVARPDPGTSLVLFDGVCNLCNSSVLFIIDRDPEARFRFAALQSDAAADALASVGAEVPDHAAASGAVSGTASGADSIVLIQDGSVYQRSDAALRIAQGLRRPWPLLGTLLVVPRPVRDWVYDLIARNRYRWFGRRDACRIPTPELKGRFVG